MGPGSFHFLNLTGDPILLSEVRTTDVYQGSGQQAFLVNSQMVNIFGFAGHTVSATITQLCHCSRKAAPDKM